MENWEMLSELLEKARIVDLAPLIENGMPKWPTHPSAVVAPTFTHAHDGFYCQTLMIGEHTGAHVDVPAHTSEKMRAHTVDTYPVGMLMGPAIKYEFHRFDPKPGERITRDQVLQLEEQMGDRADKGNIVLLDYGWQKYYATDAGWAFYSKNEPGMDEDAVLLFQERGVRAIGSDTVGCDIPLKDGKEYFSYGHALHWLPNEIFLIEMLQNLDQLPTRCYFCALPLRMQEG